MHSITVISNNNSTNISYNCAERKCLSDILRDNHIILNTACGGHGICKKCIVAVSEPETSSFKYVCACKYIPTSDITVDISKSESTSVLSFGSFKKNQCKTFNAESKDAAKHLYPNNDYGCINAAIDLGSTSISIGIYNHYEPIKEITFPNPTICYGADIISRISSATGHIKSDAMNMLKNVLHLKLAYLFNICRISFDVLDHVVISCNNAMQYLLLELDINDAFIYPFKSCHTSFDVFNYNEFFHTQAEPSLPAAPNGTKVYLIDSFSSFIGGDILSGLYFLNALEQDEPFLFIDLGTNAEMVIGNKNNMLCTSAAAGPAFEASGLTYGTAYIPGAVCDVSFAGKTLRCKTVNDQIPTGICGSGALYILSLLIQKGIVDSTGALDDDFIDTGFPVAKSAKGNIIFSQKDIRKIQLAIAAIRSGVNILLASYNIAAEDIKHIFISGSFGSALDFSRLNNLHILKQSWVDKNIIKACGNTSLNGAIKYANNADNASSYINTLKTHMTELALSEQPGFNEIFLSEMNF